MGRGEGGEEGGMGRKGGEAGVSWSPLSEILNTPLRGLI